MSNGMSKLSVKYFPVVVAGQLITWPQLCSGSRSLMFLMQERQQGQCIQTLGASSKTVAWRCQGTLEHWCLGTWKHKGKPSPCLSGSHWGLCEGKEIGSSTWPKCRISSFRGWVLESPVAGLLGLQRSCLAGHSCMDLCGASVGVGSLDRIGTGRFLKASESICSFWRQVAYGVNIKDEFYSPETHLKYMVNIGKDMLFFPPVMLKTLHYMVSSYVLRKLSELRVLFNLCIGIFCRNHPWKQATNQTN